MAKKKPMVEKVRVNYRINGATTWEGVVTYRRKHDSYVLFMDWSGGETFPSGGHFVDNDEIEFTGEYMEHPFRQ